MEYDLMDIGSEENDLTPNEQDLLLTNLNDELLIESIEEQIEKPASSFYEKTNYIDIFETRYNYIKDRFGETPDLIKAVTDVRFEFFRKVFALIKNHYGLEVVDPDGDENMYIMTKVLYEFLILDYIENVKTFVIQFIKENKKALATQFYEKNRRVESTTLRKTVKNPNDVIILSSMYKIIDEIVSIEHTVENMLRYIVSNDEAEYNNYFMNKYFIEDDILVSEILVKRFLSILNRNNDNFIRMVNEIQMEYLQQII